MHLHILLQWFPHFAEKTARRTIQNTNFAKEQNCEI